MKEIKLTKEQMSDGFRQGKWQSLKEAFGSGVTPEDEGNPFKACVWENTERAIKGVDSRDK